MIDPMPPCGLSGREPSSTRIEEGRDIENIGPTEDAVMRQVQGERLAPVMSDLRSRRSRMPAAAAGR
jgi:hypothetical protein